MDSNNLDIIYHNQLWNNFEDNNYKCTSSDTDNICPYILILEFFKKQLLLEIEFSDIVLY